MHVIKQCYTYSDTQDSVLTVKPKHLKSNGTPFWETLAPQYPNNLLSSTGGIICHTLSFLNYVNLEYGGNYLIVKKGICIFETRNIPQTRTLPHQRT